MVPAARRVLVPAGDSPGFAETLLRICLHVGADVLVPTVDDELLPLARLRASFAREGVTLLLARASTLEMCLDKWALHKNCRGSVRVPNCWLADERLDPREMALPAIVKPRRGSGSRGVRLLERRAQVAGLPRDGTLLVQEYLPGPEWSIDVLAGQDGSVRAVVPRARLRVDSGVAIAGRTLHDEGLEAFGRTVARVIGLTTVANVQVKGAADGRPALLEVNPRFPGTMPLTIAAGIDMPSLALADALAEQPTPEVLEFADVAMVRYLEQRLVPVADLAAEGWAASRGTRHDSKPVSPVDRGTVRAGVRS
jgi:carbamoyl-phosphate synthase large subunit